MPYPASQAHFQSAISEVPCPTPPCFKPFPSSPPSPAASHLATGIPMLGFALLTGSAIINLIGAIREKKRGDSGFFAAWACLNSWFATHSGGH